MSYRDNVRQIQVHYSDSIIVLKTPSYSGQLAGIECATVSSARPMTYAGKRGKSIPGNCRRVSSGPV